MYKYRCRYMYIQFSIQVCSLSALYLVMSNSVYDFISVYLREDKINKEQNMEMKIKRKYCRKCEADYKLLNSSFETNSNSNCLLSIRNYRTTVRLCHRFTILLNLIDLSSTDSI